MKTPTAKKLPSGSWRTQVRINGKYVSITAATKKECEVQAALLKTKYQTGQAVSVPADITLEDAIDKYINSRDNILSPSTIRGYDIIKRNRFKNVMDKPIKSIKDWQSIINEESANYSAKTMENSWGLIKSVLTSIGIDPGSVTLPLVITKDYAFLQPEEIKIFVKAIEEDTYELPYLLCLHGLRRSEMLALEKTDITKDEIKIYKAKVPNKDNKLVVKPKTKNASSSRSVPLLIPRIYDLVQINHNMPIKCCDKNMNYHLEKLCQKIDITSVTLHDLRRSFASLCYHLKITERQCMEFGGWNNPATMHKIYIQIAKKDRNEATEALRSFFV